MGNVKNVFFSQKLDHIKKHFHNIYTVCEKRFEKGCGSYLFDGKNYEYSVDNFDKQELLFEKVKNKKDVLEVGTYMGHSMLIMLAANPNLNITTIDIDEQFAKPSVRYLQKQFPKSNITFINSDSLNAMKSLNKKFDFFHIDGSHKNKIITKEFYQCKKQKSTESLEIIFDDDITCKTLISNIKSTYSLEESISKGEGWYTNLYIKVNFPKSKYKRFKLDFIFFLKNLLKYLNLKFNKLRNLKKI